MNIRTVYFALALGLSVALLFEWTSEKRQEAVEDNLIKAETPSFNIDGEKYIAIENDDLYVVVEIEKGKIVETRLKKHTVENVEGSSGYRVLGESSETAFMYYFASGFTKKQASYVLNTTQSNTSRVVLTDNKNNLTKTISFMDRPYEISVLDEVVDSPSSAGKPYASLFRTEGRALDLKRGYLEGGMMNNSSYEGVAISSEADPYETYRLRKIDNEIDVLSRSGWIAFVQKYFFAAILGSEDYIYNYQIDPKQDGRFSMGYTVESSNLGPSSNKHEHRLFVGPKIRKDLMERADNLELSIDMGWFWFLAQPMVYVMDLLNGYINNWGITIIVFTVLIKLLFWPVTAKSFRSMASLRKISPELTELRERYKDDRQKQGTETMKLMKKHGANPLGGCLPLLIQMPFFIGFFFALREMVELRHSSLGFWADLSAPDPYFVLPALFAVLMVLTQRLNPQAVGMDPTQAKVMKFMPVMFSLLFVFFPAALCLYTVVNTGVQLAQQSYLYKQQGALNTE
ncbi:MAG: insertase [Gammaproteobacteria bacterium]|nr:insertase [Gammaproteobacteria bacterium]|tara:strand:- start:272 stop:1813 length:1542 start_codon:yes stop_codon:yes gene_type:complete